MADLQKDIVTCNLLDVIPDILLWIDNSGCLLDYHPNNHAFLFDRKEGVVGYPLEDIFNQAVGARMMDLAALSRETNEMQMGKIGFPRNGSEFLFECRIAPLDPHRLIAGWREISPVSEFRHIELIRGNCRVTSVLLNHSDLDQAIRLSFNELGKAYRVDRIFLFRNKTVEDSPDPAMALEYDWSHPDFPSLSPGLQYQLVSYPDVFPDLYQTLEKNQQVMVLTEDLPCSSRQFLIQMGIRSVALTPVLVRNHFWGFLGAGDCRISRIWLEEEVSGLQSVAVVLGAMFQRHEDQEELTIARLRAEESDRLKSSILANMNHEFRTPMTGILGFSEILSNELPEPVFRQMAANIYLSGKRLLSTLNSMIELAQFEARKAELKLRETKLNELILVVCERYTLAAQQKGLEFEIRMTESVFSYVDEKLFTQLLEHILENAVKFTPSGSVVVETANRWETGKCWSCISVKDTGPGIPEEFHEVIFEEFRQVSEGYNRSFEGSGLGLTLAKKIVELMQGKLTLQNHAESGSVFTIWLPSSPIRPSEPPSQIPEPHFVPETPYFPLPARDGRLPSLLIVEDNRLNSELVLIYLRNICNCDMAQTGETALRMARERAYDIILMDINLGCGIDGMETTRRLRAFPGYETTPIIAVTGYTVESDVEQIMRAGCSHYLSKPVERQALSSLLESLIPKGSPLPDPRYS